MSGVFSRSSLEHATAGSAGTALATLLFYPLDRIKTLLQTRSDDKNSSLPDIVAGVLREEGIGGFYHGCTPMVQTVALSNYLFFFMFEGLKERLADAMGRPEGEIGPYESLAASACSGTLNMLVTEPLWKACVVAQSQARSERTPGGASKSVFATVWRLRQTEGARALWGGLGSSLWLVSNPVIQFFAYDFFKAVHLGGGNGDISAPAAFLMGALAKALATLLTFPLQVAQSRLRAALKGSSTGGADGQGECESPPELRGMIPCLRAVMVQHGLQGLYFGIGAKLLQTVTQAAFMAAFYEKIHFAISNFRISREGKKGMRRMYRRLRIIVVLALANGHRGVLTIPERGPSPTVSFY